MLKYINSAIFIVAALMFAAFPAFAQENEPVVIDEVVAQVNDGVITLSRVKSEMKTVIDSLTADGKKSPEEARKEVEGRMGELIANMINEELLLQKAKEVGVETDAQINQRFLQIMKDQKLKTLDALFTAMRQSNVNPDDIRETWRKQIAKDEVLQREVDGKVYYGWSSKEVKDYYEKNKAKFTKPENVVLSEIFLSYAGRDKDAVKSKAFDIVSQARKGTDFNKLAVENSERQDIEQTKGKAGSFKLGDLSAPIIAAIKNVKAGGVTDPFETDEGLEIVRVDERTAASSESVFDENAVRGAMTYEKLPDERRKYLMTLRKEAYIKISDSYRAIVSPLLFEDDRKAEVKKVEAKKGK